MTHEKSKIFVLGVRVDNITRSDFKKRVDEFLQDNKFHQIATVNPEIILKAYSDKSYKEVLNKCDLNTPDGAGLKLAFWQQNKKMFNRITGVEITNYLLKIAHLRNLKVFFFVNQQGLSSLEEIKKSLLKIYPNLKLEGVNCLPESKVSEKIEADILFCNFGAPFQEKFLQSLKSSSVCPEVKIAVGIGGAFDYLTGKMKYAPDWMRRAGLEWFYRLIQKPSRFGRVFRAVVIFPLLVIFSKKSKLSLGL